MAVTLAQRTLPGAQRLARKVDAGEAKLVWGELAAVKGDQGGMGLGYGIWTFSCRKGDVVGLYVGLWHDLSCVTLMAIC